MLSLHSTFFKIQNICFNVALRKNARMLLLSKINAQIQHLINISLQRVFIVKSIAHHREH